MLDFKVALQRHLENFLPWKQQKILWKRPWVNLECVIGTADERCRFENTCEVSHSTVERNETSLAACWYYLRHNIVFACAYRPFSINVYESVLQCKTRDVFKKFVLWNRIKLRAKFRQTDPIYIRLRMRRCWRTICFPIFSYLPRDAAKQRKKSFSLWTPWKVSMT